MAVDPRYQADGDAILARRHDNGADLWATPDRRLAKGGRFSTLEAARLLVELGVEPSDPVLQAATELIWSAWREDGRLRLAPDGAIYPCQTVHAADVLGHLGFGADPRLQRTFDHLLAMQHDDGGRRCAKFSFGRGPETAFSNPGPTLTALDAFRFGARPEAAADLDRAVNRLLDHWTSHAPIEHAHSAESDQPVRGFRSPSVGGRGAADARARFSP